MPESREFNPLKEFGNLPINETSEFKFYADEYKGYKYGSIRTFVKGDTYSGPTKSGITLNPTTLEGTIAALEKLPAEPAALEEKELARFPKKVGVELVVRITIFKDSAGVDLREWVSDQEYTGWSKKGIRIPYKDIKATLDYLKEMKLFLGDRKPRAAA